MKYLEAKDDYDKALRLILLEKNKIGFSVPSDKYYFDLIPVVNKSDKFGEWSVDPLFGLLKVYVVSSDKRSFPTIFKLDQVRIFYRLFMFV